MRRLVAEGTGLLVIYAVIHFKGIDKQFAFFDQLKIDYGTVRLILVQSSPLIMQFAISIMSWEYFYLLIEHHGKLALAVSNTMRNIFGLFGIFSWAFAAATNTLVSNIIGQGKSEEVMPLIYRVSKISFLISLVIFVVLNLQPEWFLFFYSQGDDFIAERYLSFASCRSHCC